MEKIEPIISQSGNETIYDLGQTEYRISRIINAIAKCDVCNDNILSYYEVRLIEIRRNTTYKCCINCHVDAFNNWVEIHPENTYEPINDQ